MTDKNHVQASSDATELKFQKQIQQFIIDGSVMEENNRLFLSNNGKLLADYIISSLFV